MQRLILISGYGGSGKTTCADLLEHRLEHAARVEADEMFRIKPFDAFGDKLGRIKMRNCCALIRTFLDEEYPEIVCSGLVWAQHELDEVVAAFGQYIIVLFWLRTSKDVRHDRVLSRARDAADSKQFLDKIEEMIPDPTPFSVPKNASVYEIDTDGKRPSEVVDAMVASLSGR